MDFKVLQTIQARGARIEVVGYGELAGSSDPRTAERLFFLREARMQLKSLRIHLEGGSLIAEPGALYYMEGRKLDMTTGIGGGLIGALARKITSGETLFLNEIRGNGVVMLEPSFGHFILMQLDNEAIIVDRGMFYAGVGDIKVTAEIQRNISSALFGGEGLFQTKISGTGVVALFSPVPEHEIQEIPVNGKVMVDGNFALIRTENVRFSVQKSSRSWISTAVSGEGLLQVFECGAQEGGKVWIAPTQSVYERMATPEGLDSLSRASGLRNTRTDGA